MRADTFGDHHANDGFLAPERRRLLMWLMLSVLAALLTYFGFRAYLNPELLFQFANSLHC